MAVEVVAVGARGRGLRGHFHGGFGEEGEGRGDGAGAQDWFGVDEDVVTSEALGVRFGEEDRGFAYRAEFGAEVLVWDVFLACFEAFFGFVGVGGGCGGEVREAEAFAPRALFAFFLF